MNPFFSSGEGGQSAAYCWGRAMEKLEINLPFHGNAVTWWDAAQADSRFVTGSEPQADAIAVWSYRTEGHVAYVESVSGDQATVTEADVSTFDGTDWGGGYDGASKTRSKAEWAARNLGSEGPTELLGYIYLRASAPVTEPVASGPYAESQSIVVDTRIAATLVSISVVGPGQVGAGSETGYACFAHYSDGTTVDVSAVAQWWITGDASASTRMIGRRLHADAASEGGTIQIHASYMHPNGRIVSQPHAVDIGRGMLVSLERPIIEHSGNQWLVTIASDVQYSSGDLTFKWLIDDTEIPGQQQSVLDAHTVSGAAGSRRLALVVTDGSGANATATQLVTLNKPPDPNQPTLYPASSPTEGYFMDRYGNPFDFQSDRITNGLVVITHGLGWYGEPDEWLKDMASAYDVRLWDEGLPRPNIAIYMWPDGSKPSDYVADNKFSLHSVFNWFFNAATWGALDLSLIRTVALQRGKHIADWIHTESLRSPPRVDISAPIHLIGHSAGGFVAAECATTLKIQRNHPVLVDLVTTLDMPFPYRTHFTSYPNPGTIERYVSSLLGGQAHRLLGIFPGTYYRSELVGAGFSHKYAHEWYTHTVWWSSDQGFAWSPFFNSNHRIDKQSLVGMSIASYSPASLTGLPLADFNTFGDVVLNSGVYTLTEVADAGIFQQLTLPIGAMTLKFSYQFTSPGDGDFLTVHWGDLPPLYIGADLAISRDGLYDAEIDMLPYNGETGTLAITLVSRGETNAVVELTDISLTISDDPDGDGLTTEDEQALGTDPLKWDTDGDGLSDGDEVHVYGTDPLKWDTDGDGMSDGDEIRAGTLPLDPESVFRITSLQVLPDDRVFIGWTGPTNHYYRVKRASALPVQGYTTLGATLSGHHMLTEEPVEPGGGDSLGFYWIELDESQED